MKHFHRFQFYYNFTSNQIINPVLANIFALISQAYLFLPDIFDTSQAELMG